MSSFVAILLLFIGGYTVTDAQAVGSRVDGSFTSTSTAANYAVHCGNRVNITIDRFDPFWVSIYNNTNQTFYINENEKTTTQFASLPSACRPVKTGSKLFWELDIEDCSPQITTNTTYITYEYTVWLDPKQNLTIFPTGDIARYVLKNASIMCQYDRTLSSEMTSPIKPNVRLGSYRLPGLTGAFTMTISYTDTAWNPSSAPATVDVDDFIYVRANLDANAVIKLKFKECFAHQTTTATKTTAGSYVLIENGCPVNSTHDNNGTIVIETNGDQQYARFKFRSFVWNDNASVTSARNQQNIYVTCTMTACRNNCASTCSYNQNTKVISSRRRRSVSDDDDTDSEDDGDDNRGAVAKKGRRRRSASEDTFDADLMVGPIAVQSLL